MVIHHSRGLRDYSTCKTIEEILIDSSSINCSNNQLTELNLCRIELGRLYCHGNIISKINLNGCYRLYYVDCDPISNLDDYFLDKNYDIDFTIWN